MSHSNAAELEDEFMVEALLVPPDTVGEGLAVGVGLDNVRVAGWGGWDGLVSGPSRTMPVPHRHCLACALTVPASALASVAATARGRAKVEVGGLLGSLAQHYFPSRASVDSNSGLDVIVIPGDNPAKWNQAMRQLRNEGTAIALMSPMAGVSEFDFYPEVHARSLRLIPLPWYLPPINPEGGFSEWHDAADRASRAVLLPSANSSGWTWIVEPGSNDNRNPTGERT